MMEKNMPRSKPVHEDGTPDYTQYGTQNITDMMKHYHAWSEQATGRKIDLRSFYIGATLRSQYQAAQREEGGERTHAARESRPKPPPPLKRTVATHGRKPSPAPAQPETDVAPAKPSARKPAAAKPKPAAAKPAAKAPAAKPATKPTTRGRAAKPSAADAPY